MKKEQKKPFITNLGQIQDGINKLSDIIGTYISLKKEGSNYVAKCPFHNEKTGSLSIKDSEGFWKCFGCGKGGNALSFIQEHERIDFKSAILKLADIVNVEPQFDRNINSEEIAKITEAYYLKKKCQKINLEASKLYQQQLQKNKPALEYLEKRGFTKETIETFGIGYANGNETKNTLLEQGFTVEELQKAHILNKKGNEKNWSRLIIPSDTKAWPKAFIGRSLKSKKEVEEAGGKFIKYLLPPSDAILYERNNHLFGADKAYGAIRKADKALAVEGPTDVMSFCQSKVENTVGSYGIVFSERQVYLMAQMTLNWVVCLDAKQTKIARNVLFKSMCMMYEYGIKPAVLALPTHEDKDKEYDPDSYRVEKGEKALNEFYENKQKPYIELFLEFTETLFDEKGIEIQNQSEVEKYITLLTDLLKATRKCQSTIFYDYVINRVKTHKGLKKYSSGIQRTLKSEEKETVARKKEKKKESPIDLLKKAVKGNVYTNKFYDYSEVTEPHDFCERYQDEMIGYPYFIFQDTLYEFDEDQDQFYKRYQIQGTKIVAFGTFWSRHTNKKTGETYYKINQENYLLWLQDNGYYMSYYNQTDIYIKLLSSKIVELLPNNRMVILLSRFVRHYLKQNAPTEVLNLFIQNAKEYTSPQYSVISNLDSLPLDFLRDDEKTHYKVFNNGFVVVSADDGISYVKELDELPKYVWSHQVINHDITIDTDPKPKSDYFDFLSVLAIGAEQAEQKLANEITKDGIEAAYKHYVDIIPNENEKSNNEDEIMRNQKLFHYYSMVGYYGTNNKSHDEACMYILVDEEKGGGGNGKSKFFEFLGYGIEKQKSYLRYYGVGGYTINWKDTFLNRFLRLMEFDIVNINDMPENTPLVTLKNVVTGAVSVRGKGSNEADTIQKFSLTAKMCGTTNKQLEQESGNDYDRRYYFTPANNFFCGKSIIAYLGRKMFIDWSDENYNDYYNDLFKFILFYKKRVAESRYNKGVIPYPEGNVSFEEEVFKKKCPEEIQAFLDNLFTFNRDILTVYDFRKDENYPLSDFCTIEYYHLFDEYVANEMSGVNKYFTIDNANKVKYLRAYCKYYDININPHKKRDRRMYRDVRNSNKKCPKTDYYTFVWINQEAKDAYYNKLGIKPEDLLDTTSDDKGLKNLNDFAQVVVDTEENQRQAEIDKFREENPDVKFDL